MYRSVGKLVRSETIAAVANGFGGPGARHAAAPALRALNRLIDVESATINSPGRAPTSVAILSPIRCARVIQPALFQLRMSPLPHSSSITPLMRAPAVFGRAP